MSETELRRKFGIGVAHFERVSVSHLGGKIYKFKPLKWLEMHLEVTCVVKIIYTFNDKKRRHKKLFSTKSCEALM